LIFDYFTRNTLRTSNYLQITVKKAIIYAFYLYSWDYELDRDE